MDDKKLKILRNVLYLGYIVALIYALVINYQGKYFSMCFVAMGTPFLFPLLLKILKVKAPTEVYIFNIIFIFFASLWGSCLGGYSLPYFDKVTHFGSGILGCELAYMLYKSFLREDKRQLLMAIFINAVNASIAVIWEFYEYMLLVFFNYDAINHYTSGVHDTITDMLMAFTAGLLLTVYLIKYDQKEENHFFVSMERKMYAMNRRKS